MPPDAFDPTARDQSPPHQGHDASASRLHKALTAVEHRIEGLKQRARRLRHRIGKTGSKKPGFAAVKRGIRQVNAIRRCGLDYVYGGGHATSPAPAPKTLKAEHSGYDCSSGACRVDQVMGINTPTGTTWTMAEPQAGLKAGIGRYITHFIKNNAGNDQHVVTRVTSDFLSYADALAAKGKEWADNWHQENKGKVGKVIGWYEVGGNDNTSRGGGMCWFNPTPARIAEFYIHVHPEGL